MPKEEAITVNAIIKEALPNAVFRAQLDRQLPHLLLELGHDVVDPLPVESEGGRFLGDPKLLQERRERARHPGDLHLQAGHAAASGEAALRLAQVPRRQGRGGRSVSVVLENKPVEPRFVRHMNRVTKRVQSLRNILR